MITRQSSAEWRGDLRSGQGLMSLGSGAFSGRYSFATRFEHEPGTNPDELIAAAHAGCFSMAFAGALADAGYSPERVHTTASVRLDKEAGGFSITHIELHTEAVVPGIDNERFQRLAEEAKVGCPVSRALKAVPISLQATLLDQRGRQAA